MGFSKFATISQQLENSQKQNLINIGLYEKKIAHDADRYNSLQAQRDRLQKSVEETRDDMHREFNEEKLRLQAEWQKQMDEKELEVTKLKDRMAYLEHRRAHRLH